MSLQQFYEDALAIVESKTDHSFNMDTWGERHGCETTYCIAGWMAAMGILKVETFWTNGYFHCNHETSFTIEAAKTYGIRQDEVQPVFYYIGSRKKTIAMLRRLIARLKKEGKWVTPEFNIMVPHEQDGNRACVGAAGDRGL